MKFIHNGLVEIKGQEYDNVEIIDESSYSTVDRNWFFNFRIQRLFNDKKYTLDKFQAVVSEEGVDGKVRDNNTDEIIPIVNWFMTHGTFENCTVLNIGYPTIDELPLFLQKDDTIEDIINPQVHPTNPFVAWWLPKGIKYRGKSLENLGFELDTSTYNF